MQIQLKKILDHFNPLEEREVLGIILEEVEIEEEREVLGIILEEVEIEEEREVLGITRGETMMIEEERAEIEEERAEIEEEREVLGIIRGETMMIEEEREVLGIIRGETMMIEEEREVLGIIRGETMMIEEEREVLGIIRGETMMIEEEREVLGIIRGETMTIEDEEAEIEEKEQIQIKREISLENDNQSFFWIKSEGEEKLATENLVPGNQVYKEKLILKKGIEYRLWDPFRSKLAASIMNGLDYFPFENKSQILYLGASTGTTVSHISDIVGPSGIVFSIEHASRVARDFLDRVASFRKNIIPILQDARKPKEYFSVFGKVDIVYVDIAQSDQTQIAINNCEMFLKKEGYFFLVIKTRSIDVTKAPKRIVEEEIEKLKPRFEVLQTIDLHPYDKDHAMVISKFKN